MSLRNIEKILFPFIFMQAVTQGQDDGRFWLISDLHYDFTYGINKNAESCRRIIPSTQLGTFGNYDCDTPWITLNQTIYSMKELAPDIDFILWTGDSVLHTRRDEALILNQTVNINMIRKITNLIKETFPGVPLIPTIGNYDFFPSAQTSDSMLDGLAKVWFNESAPSTFKKGGYYAMDINPNLRLLNLNMILYYKVNKNINPSKDIDPAGQFAWLEKKLQSSRRDNKKVFITGHISPGITPDGRLRIYPNYNEKFIKLIQRYTDVINGMFFGHDHEINFKVITENGMGSVPIFVAPSVTPWTYYYNHNPSMWLVTYNRQLVIPVRIDQYYSDLLQANQLQKLKYELSYSIPGAYRMENISGESLLELRERMKSDDALFEQYIKHMYADVTTYKHPEINLDLKIVVLCAMNNMDVKSFGTCKAHGNKPVNGSFKISINTTIILISLIIAVINSDQSSFF